MDINKLELYQKKLRSMSQHQLVGIYLDSFLSGLNLELTNGRSQQDKIIRFTQVMGFAIEKTPEDDEGYFVICEMDINLYDENNKNIILLKSFINKRENNNLFHFY